MEKIYKVKKIGWENNNNKFNVVLVNAEERGILKIDVGSIVKVKKVVFINNEEVQQAVFAVVNKQFKGATEATVNSLLAEKLDIENIDDTITIQTDGFTESEAQEIQKLKQQLNPFGQLFNLLRGA